MNDYFLYSSQFGEILISSNNQSINGIWFIGQRHFPTCLPRDISHTPSSSIFLEVKSWLDAYFQGLQPPHTLLPLQLSGSEFQLQIWNLLLKIPYGNVITYGQLAQQYSETTGVPGMSAQAVGAAVGRNPISIIVPCHRVIGASGGLVGYAGGIELKSALLKHEGLRF